MVGQVSKVKTRIGLNEVKQFLVENFSEKSNNLEPLKGGEVSQAFSFEDQKQSYIIKIRKIRKIHAKRKPFEKELNAYKSITSRDKSIPIPKIIQKGVYLEEEGEKYIYCITEKAGGSFVHLFPQEKQRLVDVLLIKMLYKIHSIDISTTSNYGHWEHFDKGNYSSWKEFILGEIEEPNPFIEEARKGGEEVDFLDQAMRRIRELLSFCTEKRYLVHADYGHDNTLADEAGNITAVFDWEHSLFGDFVYDIAWLDFWRFREEGAYAKIYQELYQNAKNVDFANHPFLT